ncbi:hypothetical protein [Cerasicoccus fimbriatus]|uniref:hypothetical protein n=1 Tax=Cerasicoccus fimbriatus TaxID=3014554 RepID=UPI0022B458B4|nr:hypothetical protein [Cerasicoccus sp. TK19100]
MDTSQPITTTAPSETICPTYIDISHYTRPGDVDSAPGIRQAVREAKETGITRIHFEAGRYILKSSIAHATGGIIHDAGSRDIEQKKDCHILLDDLPSFTLHGAVDQTGKPATTLVGWNDLKNDDFLPAILWCEHCPELRLQNLAFTREPAFTSAGLVTQKTNDAIIVEVLPGCPSWDNMGAYCVNRFTDNGAKLTGESITYGQGASANWKSAGQDRLKISDARMHAMVNCGEYLSWHQGAKTDFQIYISQCDNLHLQNLRTYNSNGFCMLTESCRNITANAVHFRPDGHRLFTGPRDAWKIFKCSGRITVDDFQVHGVRMDGQNMHSNWLHFQSHIDANEAIFFCKYTYAPILPGSVIEFYDQLSQQTRIVKSARLESVVENETRGHLYRVQFTCPIPEFVRKDTICSARGWEADQYTCTNSEFMNIAGAGHLSRYDNLTILNNRYQNIMNPGVLLGAEMPTHSEGGHATNIHIAQCEFDNCGFFPRYGTAGCIGVHSFGFDLPLNHDIEITENHFRNSTIGIQLMTARDVRIWNNQYENIDERVRIDKDTTRSIHIDET